MQDPNQPFPAPSLQAINHSERLVSTIQEAIEDAGGALPFSDYMRLALYAPGLGYYQSGTEKLGIGGDFVTAPEISPAFGRVLGEQIAGSLEQTGGNTILELGAGSGHLAAEILRTLSQLGLNSITYQIIEVSGDLRQRQEKTLLSQDIGTHQLQWLNKLPKGQFRGVIVANEVADAIPVERFCWRRDRISRLAVQLADTGKFGWTEIEPTPSLAALIPTLAAQYHWEDEYTSEIGFELTGWIKSLAACIEQGEILLIDYGLREHEYYHRDRTHGTLRCHYRQFAHSDPFLWPGLTDLSSWVDFTVAARAGEQVGMRAQLSTQSNFLLEGNIGNYVDAAQNDFDRYRRSSEVQKLVMPSEMGESFKVLSLTRDCNPCSAVLARPLPWAPPHFID